MNIVGKMKLVKDFEKALRDRGITPDQALSLAEGNKRQELLDSAADLIQKMLKPKTYRICVDYGMSFREMVDRANFDEEKWTCYNCFGWSYEQGIFSREVQIVHFDRRVLVADVLSEIGKKGLIPALPEDLITFCAAYPEERLDIYDLGRTFKEYSYGTGDETLKMVAVNMENNRKCLVTHKQKTKEFFPPSAHFLARLW